MCGIETFELIQHRGDLTELLADAWIWGLEVRDSGVIGSLSLQPISSRDVESH